jgi:FixJ family two-component response regulator
MPGMSGLDLQSRLRADGYDTPIIFITASPEERFRARALNGGAVGFLSKPLNEKSLMECVNSAVASLSPSMKLRPGATARSRLPL